MGHHTTVPFWVVTDHMKFAHVWSSFEDHGRWSCVDQPKNQTDHFFKWTKPWWHFSREKMASHSPKKIQPTKNKSPVPFGTKRVADRFSKTSADPNTPNDMLQHFYNRAEMLSEVATHLGSDWVDAISCLKKRWGICHFAMLVFNKGGMLNVGICRTPMLKLELFFWGLEYSPKLGRLPGWKDNTVFEVRHPVFFGQKAKTKLQIFRCPNGWISSQGHGSFKRNMLTLLWRPGHSHFCFSLRMRNAMRYTEFTWKLGHFLMEHFCTYYPTLKKYNLGPTTLIKAVRVVNISYMLHDPLWDGLFFNTCRCLPVSGKWNSDLRMPTFAWELTIDTSSLEEVFVRMPFWQERRSTVLEFIWVHHSCIWPIGSAGLVYFTYIWPSFTVNIGHIP